MVAAALVMWLFLEERPRDEATTDDAGVTAAAVPKNDPRNTFGENFLLTITNRKLWLLGISLGIILLV